VSQSFSVSIKSNLQKPYTIQLYNASGLFIREIKSSKSEIIVSLAELQAGMYFLQIRNAYDRLLKTEKVIKL